MRSSKSSLKKTKFASKYANDHGLKRSSQPVAKEALGLAWTSPERSRAKRGNIMFEKVGAAYEAAAIERRLAALEAQELEDSDEEEEEELNESDHSTDNPHGHLAHPGDTEGYSNDNVYTFSPDISRSPSPTASHRSDIPSTSPKFPLAPPKAPKRSRANPSHKKQGLYQQWLHILPTLVTPYVSYMQKTYKQTSQQPLSATIHLCPTPMSCTHKHSKHDILCLYAHRKPFFSCLRLSSHQACGLFPIDFEYVYVYSCPSAPLVDGLIRHGLFPSAPTRPNCAFAIELLELYKALFTKSFSAMEAMAGALNDQYARRGFRLTNTEVSRAFMS